MKKFIIPPLFVLAFLLVGCLQKENTASIITLTPERVTYPTESLTPINTAVPSITLTREVNLITNTTTDDLKSPTHVSSVGKATSTLTPMPTQTTSNLNITPAIPSEAKLKVQCLNIATALPPDLLYNGMLVLDSWVDSHNAFKIDMTSGTKIQVNRPNEKLISFAVSPNRKWLAYCQVLYDDSGNQEVGKNLVITTADGQQQKAIPWEKEWGTITAWLDDNRIVINMPIIEDNVLKAWHLLILDPFTGDRQVLQPDYPNLYQHAMVTAFGSWGSTIYNPTLTRVVYLQGGEDGLGGPFHFVLWDINDHQSLASYTVSNSDAIPRWKLNGEEFVASFKTGQWPTYELYLVSHNSQATQLTHLTSFYPWVYIDDFSWSPDERYIAFWFSSWLKEKPKLTGSYGRNLAVLDTISGEVTNYCIPGDYMANRGIRRVPPPLWSPDSKQLIVQNIYSEEHSRVILVDLVLGSAFQVAEDMEPVGWMVNP